MSGYSQDSLKFFEPSPDFHSVRFYSGTGLSAVAYGGTLYGLSQIWYKDESGSNFHFKDDWGAWQNIDKAGHVYTNYFESVWVSNSLKWAGIPHSKAIWYGAGASLFFQTTIEILDGYSERWGFSWSDMGANILGAGLFLGQEYLWQEQRILLKSSFSRVNYPSYSLTSTNGDNAISSPLNRANSLYGTNFFEKMLKDYNGQTIWASFNIADFMQNESWPRWLGVSLGYGAQNMYGTYGNVWMEGNSSFSINNLEPYQQFYVGPDIHWGKISTRSHFINTLFDLLDVIRLPFPALEVNTRGKFIWHWLLI